jgi:hypothetical protein
VWIELAREKHRGGLQDLICSTQLGDLAAQRFDLLALLAARHVFAPTLVCFCLRTCLRSVSDSMLAGRYGEATDEGISVGLPLSQEDLAAWTGASRAGVAHALQTMRELGWVRTDRRTLTVLNLEELSARAA